MDERTLRVLEFDKVRARLAEHTAFSLGRERALALLPSADLREARVWQAETSEARRLLEETRDVHLGGVHDVRPAADQAARGGVLLPADLLRIRSTLARAQALARMLARFAERFPHVCDVAARIAVPEELVDEIGRCIDEHGEVMDAASEALARIRRELREAHARLMDRLQRIVGAAGNAQYLQEPIVTQRQGRYVVPLRAEFKGRIPGLVHDQSGSGATLFIEPLAVVDLNNRWREAQLAEQEEIQRILAALTARVGAAAGPIVRTVETLADLDLIFARAGYADALRAAEPRLEPFAPVDRAGAGEDSPEPLHPGGALTLVRARHPLLDPETVVPIDVVLDDAYFIVVITGPNTGGKTVALKTTGLLTLMAQAGMAIPADEGSAVSVFEQIFADIGDEQSIEQSLSTFSSHMTQIVGILREADARSLVLLDELGAGTDPEEGAALAQAVLATLLARGVTTLATTHYSQLKVFAHATPCIANASVEFDIETLSPTYELRVGLPGRSNAFAIAQRLGLDRAVVARAEALVSPESLDAEAMLAEIERAQEAARAGAAEALAAQRHADALGAELAQRLAEVEAARRQVLAEARAQADAELSALRDEVAELRRRLPRRAPDGAGVDGRSLHERWLADAEAVLARRALVAAEEPSAQAQETLLVEGPLAPGDGVWVPSLQAAGEVAGVSADEVEVKVGSFRVRLAPHRVELRRRGAQLALQRPSGGQAPAVPSPGVERDLRGLTVDDMLIELDRYVDAAYRAGLPFVRVIHGKGTGALRQAARAALHEHPLVGELRPGEAGEGGDGVTVAKLVAR